MPKKNYLGDYTREDYKEWGGMGGRPPKFQNEAEKKKFYRQQKKLQTTGQPLRQYRSKVEIQKSGDTRYLTKMGWALPDKCPNCHAKFKDYSPSIEYEIQGKKLFYKDDREKMSSQVVIPTCHRCQYQLAKEETFYRAKTNAESQKEYRERKKQFQNQADKKD